SPLGRDQGATAVGEAGQHEQNTAAAGTADDGQRTTLKGVALARDNYRIGKIPVMGSLSPLLWEHSPYRTDEIGSAPGRRPAGAASDQDVAGVRRRGN